VERSLTLRELAYRIFGVSYSIGYGVVVRSRLSRILTIYYCILCVAFQRNPSYSIIPSAMHI
jgi:hypothetical protein